jgi:hypothetical protein
LTREAKNWKERGQKRKWGCDCGEPYVLNKGLRFYLLAIKDRDSIKD